MLSIATSLPETAAFRITATQITGSGILSIAMTEKEIDTLATAVLSGLKETFRQESGR
jgi:hypothetical protein